MNRRRQKPRTKECSPGKSFLITHCVACNYESTSDFDVCPRCKSSGMAVLVVKRPDRAYAFDDEG